MIPEARSRHAQYLEAVLASRNSFLLRIDPEVMAAIRKWAAHDLRSVNGQIEFLLRPTLKEAGRYPSEKRDGDER